MPPKHLSKADARILAQVFDPESAPNKAEVSVDPYLPPDNHVRNPELLDELRTCEKRAVTLIEQYETGSPSPGNAGQDAVFQDALKIIDQLIENHPTYASAFNNRAQLRRWRYGDHNMLIQKAQATQKDADRMTAARVAVEDLKTCISLASPARPTDTVSPSQGRLLGQAYTQLAALYYAAAKDMDSPDVATVEGMEFENWTREIFEEEASRLFYFGGLYGNEVAKALAVHTNPHAKLCGSIVKEAMRKELAQE